MIVSAAKVMSSVLKVLWFRTKTTLIMRGDKASDKRLMIANFAIFPMLAAKFLPLKMLTVLSFLIFPYFHSLYRCAENIGSREYLVCFYGLLSVR